MANKKYIYLASIALLLIIVVSYFYHFRIDLTSEKRYTVSAQTKELMKKADGQLNVTVYLDGDLNPGFIRLKKSTGELLDELSVYAAGSLHVSFVNPSAASDNAEREKNQAALAAKGMVPTVVYERDKEGKSIQKTIFPWLEINYNNKTVRVLLLKNIPGNSGDENLNISVENLEFAVTDGIRRVTNTQVNRIAFVEGHDELNEAETYDISKALSQYFQIDRGAIQTDASILDPYKCIIIARPLKPFTENEKFVIDQYIMNGGKVLWLLDGVRFSKENLSKSGVSPVIEEDVNLSDQLFRYGVRVNPVLLQDVQCASVPVNVAPAGAEPQFEASPWYFAPLLLTSPEHPVTRNVPAVKAEFASALDLVGDNKSVTSSLLLATSNNTHVVGVPSTIDLAQMPKPNDKAYFNTGYVPVAVALEGNFDSDFANRILPKEVRLSKPAQFKSNFTRQIIIACGDMIRNETNGVASDSTTLPLGFDRYTNQQYGNRDFIQNAVLYLTDKEGWMQLRNRTFQLRLLNKDIIQNDRLKWQLINTILPLVVLALFGLLYNLFRRRKYNR